MIADSGLLESLGITNGMDLDTDVRAQVDTWLGETLGTDLEELRDVAGDEMALGIYNVDFGRFLDTTNASMLIAVEMKGDAAAFLDKTIAFVETEQDVSFTETSHGEDVIHTADDVGGESMSLTLSDGVLIMANDADLLVAALDARAGESLADDPDFADVLAELPEDRMVTAYLAVDPLAELYEQLLGSPLLAGTAVAEDQLQAGLEAVHGVGMSVVLDSDSARIDLVTIDDPEDPEFAAAGPMVASDMPDRLPADTVAYAGFGPIDLGIDWQTIRDEMSAAIDAPEMASVQGLLDWVEFNAGVSFQEDLFDQLTGEMAFGLFPATEGVIAASGEANLGFVAGAGINDPASMADTIEALLPMAQMLIGIEPTQIAPGLYSLPMGDGGGVVIGIAGDYAVIASHEDHANLIGDGAAEALSGSPVYQQTMSALPDGSVPVFYLDVTGLINAIEVPDDVAAMLAPLQSAGVSIHNTPGVSLITMVVFIDY